MQECANHVPFQLPNEFTRVTHLLDNIQCDDASLQAAMALVRNDRAVAPVPGKMNNFEDAAAFIIPHDPVAKKRRATQKRNQVTVASADAEENKRQKSEALISSTSAKTSVGKTGVELRFYKRKEYNALTKEQKHELWQWQQNNKAKRNSTSETSSTKDAKNNDIAAAVAKELNKRKEAEETENEQQANFEKYIMSIVAKQSSKVTASSMQSQVEESPKVTINSILKRVNPTMSTKLSKSDKTLKWDPGDWTPGVRPNRHVLDTIVSSTSSQNIDDSNSSSSTRTELDSHANMPVVGKNAFIIHYAGRRVDVSPFTPDYDSLQDVPVVDAAVYYICPYSGTEALLIIRNALHVPSMTNNLIPPFIIREAGVILNDTPKIHVKDPTADDHALIFPSDDFRIPLKLHGIFSYFNTRAPTDQEVRECENVHLLTPENRWDPHDTAYSHNEDAIMDWEGNVKDKLDIR